MITEEKNKYVKLKQVASQTITELTEQVKVLENETEIQSTIVNNKDRCVNMCFVEGGLIKVMHTNAEKKA